MDGQIRRADAGLRGRFVDKLPVKSLMVSFVAGPAAASTTITDGSTFGRGEEIDPFDPGEIGPRSGHVDPISPRAFQSTRPTPSLSFLSSVAALRSRVISQRFFSSPAAIRTRSKSHVN